MMDLIYTIFQTLGSVVAVGISAVIPALYVASMLRYIPWLVSAPAMAVVAALVAYPTGMMEGAGSERARWEIKLHNMRSAMAVKKHQAEVAVLAIEEKYLISERKNSKLSRGKDRALVNLMRALPTQLESKTNETRLCPDIESSAPLCRPYDMLVPPSILLNIKER